MSTVPDAWEDEWSQIADHSPELPVDSNDGPAKSSKKASKAQRRAQQAEFNKQFWAAAEAPPDTNYFLESRNVVPLRQDFKAPPVLLSRKGPIIQSIQSRPENTSKVVASNTTAREESSEDEEDAEVRKNSLAERQAQAAREREEKQRKYEERRLELFGPQANAKTNNVGVTSNNTTNNNGNNNKSGTSSPGSGTPPHSRSSTPNRGRRGRGRGGPMQHTQSRPGPQREMYDPQYAAKPDSIFLARREQSLIDIGTATVMASASASSDQLQPVRAPRGPDGSGRGGFGFAPRGSKTATSINEISEPVQSV